MFLLWKINSEVAPEGAALLSGQYTSYWEGMKKQDAI